MTSIFIARQPILDLERNTFGYELLHRDAPVGAVLHPTVGADRDQATRSVIERAFLHWGMERLIGDRFGFINADPHHIEGGLHKALPAESIIFELHDHIGLGHDHVSAIARARGDGYHFALDNVTDVDQLVGSSLLPFVSMVKIDVDTATPHEAERIVQFVRAVQPGVHVIAEHVAGHAQFEVAAAIGCDLFQGFFFAEPQLLERSARPANAAAAIALLAEIQRDDASITRVEELVGSDASLAYRVLAVVNSSAFGLDRRVESLDHAIVLLGLHQVRNLAILLTLSSAGDADQELITLGATRAKLASLLVPDRELRSSAFTVGLLSITDALYRTPMRTLLEDLPLAEPVRAALLDGSGVLGAVLGAVKACERADVHAMLEFAPGRLSEINTAYAEAAQWADTLRRQLALGAAASPLASSTPPRRPMWRRRRE